MKEQETSFTIKKLKKKSCGFIQRQVEVEGNDANSAGFEIRIVYGWQQKTESGRS